VVSKVMCYLERCCAFNGTQLMLLSGQISAFNLCHRGEYVDARLRDAAFLSRCSANIAWWAACFLFGLFAVTSVVLNLVAIVVCVVYVLIM